MTIKTSIGSVRATVCLRIKKEGHSGRVCVCVCVSVHFYTHKKKCVLSKTQEQRRTSPHAPLFLFPPSVWAPRLQQCLIGCLQCTVRPIKMPDSKRVQCGTLWLVYSFWRPLVLQRPKVGGVRERGADRKRVWIVALTEILTYVKAGFYFLLNIIFSSVA